MNDKCQIKIRKYFDPTTKQNRLKCSSQSSNHSQHIKSKHTFTDLLRLINKKLKVKFNF